MHQGEELTLKINTLQKQEKQVLAQLKSGSEEAFTSIFNRYAGKLYGICLAYTSNQQEAEELVQESFTRIWQHRHRINPDLPLLPYLIRISKNLLVDKTRKKLFETAYLKYQKLSQRHYTFDTENQIFLNELKALLEKQISEMPEKREKIFRMSREQGLTNQEIAEEIGISVSTVENHINTALKQLKRHLGHSQALGLFLLFMWY